MRTPQFYDSNFDKYFTPTKAGWYIQYHTESGDSGAILVDREPTSEEDALNLLYKIDPTERWMVGFYAKISN